MIRLHALAIGTVCVTLAACAREQAPPYDLVVASGRVLDPESGLDAVRHVGISKMLDRFEKIESL